MDSALFFINLVKPVPFQIPHLFFVREVQPILCIHIKVHAGNVSLDMQGRILERVSALFYNRDNVEKVSVKSLIETVRFTAASRTVIRFAVGHFTDLLIPASSRPAHPLFAHYTDKDDRTAMIIFQIKLIHTGGRVVAVEFIRESRTGVIKIDLFKDIDGMGKTFWLGMRTCCQGKREKEKGDPCKRLN